MTTDNRWPACVTPRRAAKAAAMVNTGEEAEPRDDRGGATGETKIEAAIRLLMQIEDAAPDEEPDEDYDDTEGAFSSGLRCGAWDAALLAQSARKILEDLIGRTVQREDRADG